MGQANATNEGKMVDATAGLPLELKSKFQAFAADFEFAVFVVRVSALNSRVI